MRVFEARHHTAVARLAYTRGERGETEGPCTGRMGGGTHSKLKRTRRCLRFKRRTYAPLRFLLPATRPCPRHSGVCICICVLQPCDRWVDNPPLLVTPSFCLLPFPFPFPFPFSFFPSVSCPFPVEKGRVLSERRLPLPLLLSLVSSIRACRCAAPPTPTSIYECPADSTR